MQSLCSVSVIGVWPECGLARIETTTFLSTSVLSINCGQLLSLSPVHQIGVLTKPFPQAMDAESEYFTASGYQFLDFSEPLDPWAGAVERNYGVNGGASSVCNFCKGVSSKRSREAFPIRNGLWPGISSLSYLIMQPTNQPRAR